MARFANISIVAVSLFSFFAFAATAAAQTREEAPPAPPGYTVVTVDPRMTLRRPWRDERGIQHNGLLVGTGISVHQLRRRVLPDGTVIDNSRVVRTVCSRRINPQTGRCVRVWTLQRGRRPGVVRRVLVPNTTRVHEVFVPPQRQGVRRTVPRPNPPPRVTRPSTPSVVATTPRTTPPPSPPAALPSPRPDPRVAQLQARLADREQAVVSYRSEAARARTEHQDAIAQRDSAQQASREAEQANRATQQRLDRTNIELEELRRRSNTSLPHWKRDPAEFGISAGIGAAVVLMLLLIGYLVHAWRRKRYPLSERSITTDVMDTIPRKETTSDARATADPEPNPRLSVPPDRLAELLSRWSGFDPTHGMGYNLERLVGQAAIAEQAKKQAESTAAEAATRQQEAADLRAKVTSQVREINDLKEQAKHLQQQGKELSEAKRTLKERDEQVSRLTSDGHAVRALLRRLNDTLVDEPHGQIDIQNGTQPTEDLIAQLIAIFEGVRHERDIARKELNQAKDETAELFAEAQQSKTDHYELENELEKVIKLVVAHGHHLEPGAPSQMLEKLLEERLPYLKHAQLPSSIESFDDEGTREIETGKQQDLLLASTAKSGDSLPPIAPEDTRPRASLLDVPAEEAARETGIDLEERKVGERPPRGKSRLPRKRDTNRDFPSIVPPPQDTANPGAVIRRTPRDTARGLGSPPPPPPNPQNVVGDRGRRFLKTEVPPAAPDGSGLLVIPTAPVPHVADGDSASAEPVDMTDQAEDAGTGSLMFKGARLSGVGMDSQVPPPDPAAGNGSGDDADSEDEDELAADPTYIGPPPTPAPADTSGESPPPKDRLH